VNTTANIVGLGWVSDLESEIATWSLSVVPIRIGGGTRVKLAQAFGLKCPVVATALGAYGYGVAHGRELWIADSSKDFTNYCLRILNHPEESHCMAEISWKSFVQNGTWEAQESRVVRVVESVLSRRRD